MIRRVLHSSALVLLLVVGWGATLMADTDLPLPEVIHPDALMLSADDQTAFDEQLDALEVALAEDLPITRKQAERMDWTEQRLAVLVAGLLSEAGFVSKVVWAEVQTFTQTRALAGLEVGDETVWIPVDVAWGDRDEDRVGRIPWASGLEGTRFEDDFTWVEGIVFLEENELPVAVIRRSIDLYVKKTLLRFYADPSEDPDGEIIIYIWTIDGKVTIPTLDPVLLRSFSRAGEYTIHLTVVDNRGATASDEITIRVLEEEPDCRACDPDL